MKDEEIKKLTVRDVISMDVFKEEMQVQVRMENESHSRAIREVASKGMVLKRTPLDSLRDKNVLDADTMVQKFAAVVDKSLIGFSSKERAYIYGMGMVCFARVLVRLKE